MAKEEKIEAQGKILESLPNGDYKVQIIGMGGEELGEDSAMMIQGYVSGKMRRYSINLIPGDVVDIELTPYDLTRGRITFRHANKPQNVAA